MRKLKIIFVISLIVIVILVLFSFLFFESEKHKSLLYLIQKNGELDGHIKLDRYKTEDKITYKSIKKVPRDLIRQTTNEKIVFNKKDFTLAHYLKESKSFKVRNSAIYIKATDKAFDFLNIVGSKFATLQKTPLEKNVSIFHPESPVTYIPFIDKYDFTIGGAQSFNALYHPGDFFPPSKIKVMFTSIRDEYIKVDGKKTKTEVIIVKAKTLPQIYIWVSKRGHELVQLKNKEASLLIKKVGTVFSMESKSYLPTDDSYTQQNVLFPSGDVAISGTLDIPKKEGKLPAAILVVGEELYDRENAGLYAGISDYLAKNGYITLRYDRRGIGKSQGNPLSVSISDEIKDINSALRFISNHKKVLKEKIFLLTHANASSYVPRLDLKSTPIRGLIMLGVTRPTALPDPGCEYTQKEIERVAEMNNSYPDMVNALKEETLHVIKNSKKEHAFLQGRQVFTKRMDELLTLKLGEGFKNLDTQVTIIQGKQDNLTSASYIQEIENALNPKRQKKDYATYFRGLGHFLGILVNEPHKIKHYKPDKEVLETIKLWIDEKCIDLPPEEGLPEEPSSDTNNIQDSLTNT